MLHKWKDDGVKIQKPNYKCIRSHNFFNLFVHID